METRTYLFDPSGNIIKRPQWDALKARDPNAWELRRYDNGRFAITLTAIDRIHTDGACPAEHWKRFSVLTHVIVTTDFEGNNLPKPKYVEDIDASGSYRTLDEARSAYERFLARYTESTFDAETGEFREQGNLLNPDVPKIVEGSTKAKAADFGSW